MPQVKIECVLRIFSESPDFATLYTMTKFIPSSAKSHCKSPRAYRIFSWYICRRILILWIKSKDRKNLEYKWVDTLLDWWKTSQFRWTERCWSRISTKIRCTRCWKIPNWINCQFNEFEVFYIMVSLFL